ncbi:YadA-like family protein, partial [Veillonella sp.]|uniref:YadA-like family protein n=2 Tax=Veillonella sp. TaxID=1926307 RepID=UPI0025F3E496
SIAIGPFTTATKDNGVAIGNGAKSLSEDSIVIGRNAQAETKSGAGLTTTSRAIAIGSYSRVAADVTQGIAIGSGIKADEGAVVTGDQSIAIGGNVKVDGHAAIAIGGDDAKKAANQQVSYTNTDDTEVTGTLQTAIFNLTGYDLSKYKGTTASHAGVAYGTSALAGNAGVAIGTASDSMTRKDDKGQVVNNKPVTNAVAIGTGARANFDNSVAIGGGSNTDHYATKQVNAIIDGVEVKWSGGENISPGDVVSFGAKGFERQLKNVAPGEVSQTSTDAINGSQIYSLARKVTNIMNGGAGSVVNVNAAGEPLSKVVTGTGAAKVENYYRTADVSDDGTVKPGAAAQTPTSLALVNVNQTDVNQQTQTPRTLGNVANGVKDNDAVNVSQLKASTVKYFSVNSTDVGNRDNAGATGTNAIAIGPTAKSTGENALAIGNNAQANSNYAVSLGHYANNGSTNSTNSISIGWVAGGSSNGASNVAIGTNAGRQVTGNNNISLGNTAGTVNNTNVYTTDSILLGTEARVKGSTASKSVNSVIAIGKGAEGSATSATSIGINANASAENAMALGPSSKASVYNGVALGSYSEATTAGSIAGYNANTSRTDKYAGLTGLTLTANTGAVSIGSSTTTRQIINLAAGTNDTDAVNVAQLKSVNLAVKGNSGAGGDVNLAINPLTIKGNDDYITTSASGNTVNISGKVQNINVSNGTATATTGMADAKNVAEAINKAVSQNAYTWNLTADNDTAGSRSTINKEGTVKFSGDQNITVARNGNTITSSLNKAITVDTVKAKNSVATGSGSNQITLDGTTGAVTGKTFSGQSFTAGDNELSNTTLQIGSPTNGNNVTITKDGLTSKAGTKTAKFGANGIDAAGQQITNVSSGGNVGTNAANITDVKNAVSDVTLNLDTNSKTGTVKLSESPLKVIGANGIRTDLVGTNNGSLVVGLDSNTVNATTKGIGLTGDSGSTGLKYLKDGDATFKVAGDGNLVITNASATGVQVAVDTAKVKDLAVAAVTVSKANTADNPITVMPTTGTNSKDYAIGIDTTKLAGKTDLTYRANNDADANAQKVSLAKGLNFVNGDNTVATVAADGKVSYDLNAATKTKIDDSATAVARNISLGTDSGTASSQSLKDGDVAFNVKGATGDYVSTNMNGNTVEISTTRATINSDANTGVASVTGNDGLATAKNVADAINKAADAAKAGAAWNLTTNSSTTDRTSVQGGDTVDLINGDNIVITQDGTDKKKITVATKKDLTVDSVTAGNTVINTSGLTNGTTAITGSGITTDKVTVGGISIDKTDGINAGGKTIANVASGGTTDTNAANIGDVKQAVANLSQNLNITDGTNNGTIDLKNQKLNVAGANGVTATVNNQTITVGLDANTVNATTKGIGLTGDTGSTGNKYLKDGDVSFAVTGDGNLVSTSATAAGVKVAVDAAKVKDLAVDAVTVSKDAQADNPIIVTPTAGTNSKDYAIGIDTTKLAGKTDLTYRANNDTDANAKKVSLAKGLNFVNGTLTTASIDNDGVVKYDVNTAAITAGTDGTVTGPTTDGVATAQNVADAINAAKKAAKTEITANTGEAANATTGNVTLTSTTAADGHTIYDVKLNDKVTLGTGTNAVIIDGIAGKATVGTAVVDGVNNTITTGGASPVTLDGATGTITGKTANIGGVTVNGATNDITGLSNTTVTGADFATKGRAATEEQLKAVTGATALKFTGDVATNTGSINLKDDTFGIKGDGKYISTDVNGKDVNLTVSEAEVKKSAVAAVTVSTDTTDANNPISVTPTTSADGTTKDYKVTIDGTKIANKTNLSYKANDGTAKQVSLADGLNFKNGTLTTASIDDAGVVKYDVNTAVITADTDGTVTGPTTDGVATAQNVADAINAAKKTAKTEITANTGEAANATTGNVTLTSTTAADGHTIYDVKLNDKVTLGTGNNAVTIDGTAGKATIGSSIVDGVNNTITTGGANAVALDGAAGTVKTGTVTVTGGTSNDITGLSNTTVTAADFATKGRAATEEQLKQVGEQTWQITADKDAATSGNQTGTKKDAKVGKDDKVQLIAGENLTVNQNERDFTYSLNKDLVKMNSATFEAIGGKTTVITGDSIAQTDGTKTNKSTAAGNTVADGTKSTETTAAGQVIKDGAKTNTSTVDENTLVDGAKSNKTTVDSNVIDDGNGNVNTSNATSNTITDGTNRSTITAGKAQIGTVGIDGVTSKITTGGANAVVLNGADGTVKTGTVTVTGGTTNDITGLSNTTVNAPDFATKGRAATEEQLKAVGEQTWQITADKDAATSGAQTGAKKDAKVGKDDKVQLIAGENLTVNQNERDFTFSLNKDLVKMNSATFESIGGKTTIITGDSITQTDGTKTNTSTAAGNTITDGTNTTETTASTLTVKDNAGNSTVITKDTITTGTGANKVTINGTAGKVIAGSAVVDGVNNKITTGGANAVKLDGAAGTVTGLTNTAWTPGVTKAVSGRAATEDQLQQVSDAVGAGWNVNTGTVAGSTGEANGSAKTKVSSGEEVQLQAGNNLIIDQNGKTLAYSLNKNLKDLESATFNAVGGKTTVIKGDSIVQTDGSKTNTSNAAGNTVIDGAKSTATTAVGTTITDGAKTNTSTADKNIIDDGAGNKATFTKDGVTITKPGKDTVSLTGNGLDNGNNKIVNVADGTNDTDAVNVRQLDAKTKAATTELTANGGESAGNTTGNIVLTKTTAPDGHIIYDNKLNDKITLGVADPTKAITIDGTNGTIKAGKDGNAVAINGTDGTIKAGDGTNAVAIDGVNGSVKVADKIALNGKDGKAAIGTVGIDGKDGIITIGGNNPVAVNGKDGVVTGLTNKTWDPNNITSGRAATEDQVQSAVANAGWDATVGTEGSGVNSTPSAIPEKIRPNETLTFKAGNNMMVSHAGKTISYAVNPELTDMKSATFKDAAGNTTVMNGNGMVITPGSANPNNPNAGPVSLTKDGLNNGNNQIKGVAPGSDDTDAVNIGQLKASNAKMGDAIGQVAGEVQRVGAHAAAMAALKPIQYDPLEPTQIMAGVGNYRGETAAALGLAHYTNEDTMFNVGVSVGGNHNMVNAGVTHKFGSSPEKKNIPDRYKAGPISSVYVMQDEVSSLKKENAEQKYVIADQAARLNTLEAENERQRHELAETKQGLDDLRAAVDRLLASKG